VVLIVGVPVPDIVDKHVSNRPPLVAALAQQHVQRVPNPRKLLPRRGWVVEEIQHQFWVEAQAGGIVQIGDDAAS
jgi:hypothetical protein